MGLVYLATNLQSGKSYPGLTTLTLAQRRQKHYQRARYNRKHNKKESHFHKALLKYDESVWQWTILEDNITDKELLSQKERYWISFYKSIGAKLYNETDGGEGMSGYKPVFTPEWRKNLSTSLKGIVNSAKTYTMFSPEDVLTEITNMNQFCRDNDLNSGNMHQVLNGNRPHHKGWRKAA